MAAFPAPGPGQDLSRLLRLDGSSGSHPVKGAGEWLFGAAAGWYNLMYGAADADGVTLRAVSGHRTHAEQWTLWRAYKAGQGNLAAYPGTSRHEYGQAVDIDTRSCTDLAVLDWLRANASRFRFVPTVPTECWHYVYQGQIDDPVPQEAPMYALPNVGTTTIRLRTPKQKSAEVTKAQTVLVHVFGKDLTYPGGPAGGIDGVWGADSDTALRDVQRELGLTVDGVWGNQTNAKIAAYMTKPPVVNDSATITELQERVAELTDSMSLERRNHALTKAALAAEKARVSDMAKLARQVVDRSGL